MSATFYEQGAGGYPSPTPPEDAAPAPSPGETFDDKPGKHGAAGQSGEVQATDRAADGEILPEQGHRRSYRGHREAEDDHHPIRQEGEAVPGERLLAIAEG